MRVLVYENVVLHSRCRVFVSQSDDEESGMELNLGTRKCLYAVVKTRQSLEVRNFLLPLHQVLSLRGTRESVRRIRHFFEQRTNRNSGLSMKSYCMPQFMGL